MDDIVLRGMARWPDVPAVYGWLALDRRGNWLLQGERIANPAVTAFIGRNFEHDASGCWFFQNGPQRVFVRLEYTPLVLRVAAASGDALEVETHTGRHVSSVDGAWLDEDGSLLLLTDLGAGLLDDRDLDRVLPAFVDINGGPIAESVLEELIEAAGGRHAVPLWFKFRERTVKIEPILMRDVPGRFGFVREPQPAEAK